MKNYKSFYMKGYLLGLVCLLYSGLTAAADIRALRQLEAAENIEMVSQQIAKAYFYVHQGIRVEQAKKDIRNGLAALARDIKVLTNTRDTEQQSMVLFLSFSQDELKETISKPFSHERGALMLDYSESLLEGAESLAKKYIHKEDKKEQMLIATQKMSFLLERATKYYIAYRDGFTDHNNVKQLQKSISEFESYLKKVTAHNYPAAQKVEVKKIADYWPIVKKFYLGVEKGDLPLIVYMTTKHLEKSIQLLGRHHDKILRK